MKNHSDMFQIVCDPSSGSDERAWLKLLVIFFVCLVGVWQCEFWTCSVCARYKFPTRRTMHTHLRFKITLPNTNYAHKNITSYFSQARSALPDDGSQKIRNMSELFLTVF